jgi:L,D-transpeptidase ErfK/SrfK
MLALLALATPGAGAEEPAAQGQSEPAPEPAPLPEIVPGEVLGAPSYTLTLPNDTLLDVAERFKLGFELLQRLNPGVDVWIPAAGTRVELPTRMILPQAPRTGLVINLPEMRLYDFTAPSGLEVFAVAVGDALDPSPVGEFWVGEKRVDPVWTVPESIREEKPHLPAQVPPGPDNPLGDRWMTVSRTSYGIHGTNNLWSIGRQATHGCIRLYESEMRRLYERTKPRTPIHIVYQPVKLAFAGDEVLLEAHPDLYAKHGDLATQTLMRLFLQGLMPDVEREVAERVVREARGVPVTVGRRHAADGATSGRTY